MNSINTTMSEKHLGIILMLFCASCLCLGQLIWKLMPGYNLIYLLGGFSVYAIGALLMVVAYRYGELSVLQPINSTSYIFSTIISVTILHENISVINIIGILFIISGVVTIGINSK